MHETTLQRVRRLEAAGAVIIRGATVWLVGVGGDVRSWSMLADALEDAERRTQLTRRRVSGTLGAESPTLRVGT